MKKDQYLQTPVVTEFIEWLIKHIDEDLFTHTYIQKRPKGNVWRCNSIYNAFENYKWRFNCTLPNGKTISGDTYRECEEILTNISSGLINALEQGNQSLLKAYCISTLQWGGVLRSNKEKIENMENALEYFSSTTCALDPYTVSLSDTFEGILMNSGFTKIYSLMIKDFIIYDGRLGAALGLLVRKYLEENNINTVPSELKFAYGNPKTNSYDKDELSKRNPSKDGYKFPLLTNNSKLHVVNNLRANWIVFEAAKQSKFSTHNSPMRALESALFMIGYDIR